MPEYEGMFVYKHHAVLYSARNIMLCGPAIVLTERMFENKLQYIKRRAKASNFRNPIHSVSPATYPALQLVHLHLRALYQAQTSSHAPAHLYTGPASMVIADCTGPRVVGIVAQTRRARHACA